MRKNLIGISGKIKSGKDYLAKVINYVDSRSKVPFEEWEPRNTYEIKKYADKLKEIVSLMTGIPRENMEDQGIKDKTIGEITGEDWIRYSIYVEKMHVDSTQIERIYLDRIFSTKEEAQKYCDDYETNELYDIIQKKVVEENLTLRRMMQLIGTEAFRNSVHPDSWVKSLFSDYSSYSKWIITDLRFPNEAERIIQEGGYLIRINRPLKLRFPELYDMYLKESDIASFEKYLIHSHNKLYKTLIHKSETGLDNYDRFNVTLNNDTNNIDFLINNIKPIILK